MSLVLAQQFTHLQHAPFEYRIEVTNSSNAPRQGTCRIFLCPRHDERGQTMRFRDQRSLLIEMDKFYVTCKRACIWHDAHQFLICANHRSFIFLFFSHSEPWTKHFASSLRPIERYHSIWTVIPSYWQRFPANWYRWTGSIPILWLRMATAYVAATRHTRRRSFRYSRHDFEYVGWPYWTNTGLVSFIYLSSSWTLY